MIDRYLQKEKRIQYGVGAKSDAQSENELCPTRTTYLSQVDDCKCREDKGTGNKKQDFKQLNDGANLESSDFYPKFESTRNHGASLRNDVANKVRARSCVRNDGFSCNKTSSLNDPRIEDSTFLPPYRSTRLDDQNSHLKSLSCLKDGRTLSAFERYESSTPFSTFATKTEDINEYYKRLHENTNSILSDFPTTRIKDIDQTKNDFSSSNKKSIKWDINIPSNNNSRKSCNSRKYENNIQSSIQNTISNNLELESNQLTKSEDSCCNNKNRSTISSQLNIPKYSPISNPDWLSIQHSVPSRTYKNMDSIKNSCNTSNCSNITSKKNCSNASSKKKLKILPQILERTEKSAMDANIKSCNKYCKGAKLQKNVITQQPNKRNTYIQGSKVNHRSRNFVQRILKEESMQTEKENIDSRESNMADIDSQRCNKRTCNIARSKETSNEKINNIRKYEEYLDSQIKYALKIKQDIFKETPHLRTRDYSVKTTDCDIKEDIGKAKSAAINCVCDIGSLKHGALASTTNKNKRSILRPSNMADEKERVLKFAMLRGFPYDFHATQNRSRISKSVPFFLFKDSDIKCQPFSSSTFIERYSICNNQNCYYFSYSPHCNCPFDNNLNMDKYRKFKLMKSILHPIEGDFIDTRLMINKKDSRSSIYQGKKIHLELLVSKHIKKCGLKSNYRFNITRFNSKCQKQRLKLQALPDDVFNEESSVKIEGEKRSLQNENNQKLKEENSVKIKGETRLLQNVSKKELKEENTVKIEGGKRSLQSQSKKELKEKPVKIKGETHFLQNESKTGLSKSVGLLNNRTTTDAFISVFTQSSDSRIDAATSVPSFSYSTKQNVNSINMINNECILS